MCRGYKGTRVVLILTSMVRLEGFGVAGCRAQKLALICGCATTLRVCGTGFRATVQFGACYTCISGIEGRV